MITKLHPLVITPRLPETAAFYCRHFEFNEVFTSDWYVQLAHRSGAELALMLPSLSNQPEILHAPFDGRGVVITLETDDVSAVFQQLDKAGVPFVYPMTEEEWGQKHFIIEDPAGTYVDVVQYQFD